MIVTTITTNRIITVSLPEKVSGQFWLYDESKTVSNRLVSIEGINDNWILKSGRKAKLLDEKGQVVKSSQIDPLEIYVLAKSNTERVYVFAEPSTKDRQLFSKFLVNNSQEIHIGRSTQNDICFDNKAVSAKHATLIRDNERWYLKDENSANGTFVNERRIAKAELFIGDSVFIMGLKIVIGKHFIAVNNPDGRVRISGRLKNWVSQETIPADYEEENESETENFFYRSPRFKRDIETTKIKIDAPPASPVTEEMPVILMMGSSTKTFCNP